MTSQYSNYSCPLNNIQVNVIGSSRTSDDHFLEQMLTKRKKTNISQDLHYLLLGLNPRELYQISFKLARIDEKKYKFNGNFNEGDYYPHKNSEIPMEDTEEIVHSDGYQTGARWMKTGVYFPKIGISKEQPDKERCLLLESLHAYFPVLVFTTSSGISLEVPVWSQKFVTTMTSSNRSVKRREKRKLEETAGPAAKKTPDIIETTPEDVVPEVYNAQYFYQMQNNTVISSESKFSSPLALQQDLTEDFGTFAQLDAHFNVSVQSCSSSSLSSPAALKHDSTVSSDSDFDDKNSEEFDAVFEYIDQQFSNHDQNPMDQQSKSIDLNQTTWAPQSINNPGYLSTASSPAALNQDSSASEKSSIVRDKKSDENCLDEFDRVFNELDQQFTPKEDQVQDLSNCTTWNQEPINNSIQSNQFINPELFYFIFHKCLIISWPSCLSCCRGSILPQHLRTPPLVPISQLLIISPLVLPPYHNFTTGSATVSPFASTPANMTIFNFTSDSSTTYSNSTTAQVFPDVANTPDLSYFNIAPAVDLSLFIDPFVQSGRDLSIERSIRNFTNTLKKAHRQKKTAILTFQSTEPMQLEFKYCTKMLLRTDKPVGNFSIQLSGPYLEHLLNLSHHLCRFSEYNLFVKAHFPRGSYGSLTSMTGPAVEIPETQENITIIWVKKDFPENVNKYPVAINSLITEAIASNGTNQVLLTSKYPSDCTIRFRKCGFMIEGVLVVKKKETVIIDRQILGELNRLKHDLLQ
ncbi:Putative T-box protein 31 [Caenorhabditis elegans]|uniref:Putative T-box protein 31 n=1 Tax=Caenorhabditis elegans TaxID=6239 RepID=TBX31_CAEEL|nr:Putative T-box protein 31 [Caenorhabditis elegans]Q9TZL0.1 RecName: Full=Putative T-box protein 31 [Caenorhabditis elegans]CCD66881.1 Putative T-box protein 31 [Caenorhabditis elegans]|eukprot:NP_508308.1 Putative T-box protein 31 [Caenorhabditis elegans]